MGRDDGVGAPLLLVADADRDLRRLLERELGAAGFRITHAESGKEALLRARRLRPALMVLARELPLVDGSEVLRRLRAARDTAQMGIVLLVTAGGEDERIAALELGADDVVAKPFCLRELQLRVAAVHRRVCDRGLDGERLRAGRIELDRDAFVVRVDGTRAAVTISQFRLLEALSDAAGRVCTREELLLRLSPAGRDPRGRVLRTQIRRLRLKLGPAGAQLETVHSVGYRLRLDR